MTDQPTKTSIHQDDPDFDEFEVRIHGTPIANVISADVEKREVWVHDGADVTKAHELKTGSITISPKQQASAGRTSRSRRSTSGQ